MLLENGHPVGINETTLSENVHPGGINKTMLQETAFLVVSIKSFY